MDICLNSLAVEKGDEAIAVILSGRGSDGTKGAVTIKQAGRIVIVHEPEICAYSSKPSSVINTDAADYQLSPELMPDTILAHINRWMKRHDKSQ
ncbi:MAG: chemotaxis protein CheB [Segetibacter sp.]